MLAVFFLLSVGKGPFECDSPVETDDMAMSWDPNIDPMWSMSQSWLDGTSSPKYNQYAGKRFFSFLLYLPGTLSEDRTGQIADRFLPHLRPSRDSSDRQPRLLTSAIEGCSRCYIYNCNTQSQMNYILYIFFLNHTLLFFQVLEALLSCTRRRPLTFYSKQLESDL